MNVQYAMRARLDSGIVRAWTGRGTVTFDEPFDPAGVAPGGTGIYEDGAAMMFDANGQLSFALRGIALTGTPLGGRTVDVFSLGYESPAEFDVLPFVRRGLLSAPRIERDGAFVIDIVPRTHARPVEWWSHEQRQQEVPGDTIFSQMRALAKGINGIHFPDVPPFDPTGSYDTLAVQQPQPTAAGAVVQAPAGSKLAGRKTLGDVYDGLPGAPAAPGGPPGIVRIGGSATVRALPTPRSNARRGL